MLPWIAAVLLGALAPALIVAGLSTNLMVLPFAFAVTLGHSMLLGLPVALFYRGKGWTHLGAAMVGAFVIGAIPVGIFAWPVSPSLRTTASVDGVTTILDGVPTLAGWLGYVKMLAMFGALGAAGGLVFWLTLRCSGALAVTCPQPARPACGRSRTGILLAGIAITASAAVAALPSITKDRSCHNLFRDGRSSARPKVQIDLDIATDDWPSLAALLGQFAASRGMSFRDASENRSAVKILGLSACNENGLVITADELLFASRNYAPPVAGGGTPVSVFDLNDGVGWQPLAQDLVAMLDAQWRGKVRFRDGSSRFISSTDALTPH